jgi:winged helix DNA-binding protein
MRHIPDVERRARLARRHAVAPGQRVADPVAATRAMTVLHATEPATVYLSLFARVDGLTHDEVDRLLYAERALVKQLAMRRTLFVFPRDLLPAAWGSASARVATQLRTRLAKDVEAAGIAEDGTAWLDAACAAVLDRLADGSALGAQALREQLPELQGRIEMAAGKSYGGNFPIAPRVLTQLGVEAATVRGPNDGHWRLSRPRWTLMHHWLGEEASPLKADEGYAELVARWLASFGPGTTADLQWWLGATAGAVKRALADVGAVQVSLDGDAAGWVLPGDTEPVTRDEPWAALLPVLDPTVMGWKERGFFLGPHGPALFDTNGNAGTTAWWDGRIVGCWVQDPGGVVHVEVLEEVGADAREALEVEAARLTAWLDGTRVSTVYPSTAMKSAAARVGGGVA